MIKKLRNSSSREGSLLNFALEVGQKYNISKISFTNEKDSKKFRQEKAKEKNPSLRSNEFNEQTKIKKFLMDVKVYEENKENVFSKINTSRNTAKLNQDKYTLAKLTQPLTMKPRKMIEFYDEFNGKYCKLKKFEESELPFTKSSILPKVKWMKVDNDVKTDDEQVSDALKMVRDNLKETMKLIQTEKDYLGKNLSRKVKFNKK